MKLAKEEIKKVAVSVLFLVGLVYGYFTILLGPLDRAEVAGGAKIATITPKIAEAKKQLQKTVEIEKKAPVVSAALEQIKSTIPDGAPVAWFPPRMAEFFKKQGIEKTQTRFLSETAEKDLPGFRKILWTIDLPRVDFVPLGLALAGLENSEPLLQVSDVAVNASKEDPQFQHATLTVATIVKQ